MMVWTLTVFTGWLEGGLWLRVGPWFYVPNPDSPFVHFLDAPHRSPRATFGGWVGVYQDLSESLTWGLLLQVDTKDVWYGKQSWTQGPYTFWIHAFRYGPSVGVGVDMLAWSLNVAGGAWWYPWGPRWWTLRMGTHQSFFLDLHRMRAWGDLEVPGFTFSMGINLCPSCKALQVVLVVDRIALERYARGERKAMGVSMVGSTMQLTVGGAL